VKGVILVHPSAFGRPSFDIFGDEELRKELDGWGYECKECMYVREHRDKIPYPYICSEDLDHVPDINATIEAYINSIIAMGISVKFVGWSARHPF